ncbi:hypothetical protein [Porphyromonas canoris]|uniref:Uncharacterized protein n=1 Tax=Porphyromonas canoris TaxID=36875 RepID=A0ABR4XM15_9PORP|nr:hypothetical protein [Porphyromonas canoris]KGN92608.1 hypothetical protein HQ43_05075 [Porphyromonas canoris]
MEMVKAQDKELKRIYQTLSKNFDGIGSEDEFKKRMQDEGSRRKVFDYLKSIDGSLKDFDTFSDRIVVRPNLNMRVSNEYGEEEFLPRRGSKTTIQDNSKDGSPSQRNSTPIRRFDEGFMQGGKALIQGGKALAGETANLFTGSSRDASEAIKVLNDFDALGIDIDSYEKSLGAKLKYRDYLYSKARREWGDMSKKDRGFISEALWRISNPEPQRYQYNKEDNKGAIKALRKAIEESGGDKKKAIEILSKWSKDETWGDKIISEAGKELSEQRPVEGAAWFGSLYLLAILPFSSFICRRRCMVWQSSPPDGAQYSGRRKFITSCHETSCKASCADRNGRYDCFCGRTSNGGSQTI